MDPVDQRNGARLDSWKAIATYLGRDEGTLRRWEQTRGLPIRRVPGRRGASVYAFTSEIDAWLQSAAPEGNGVIAPEPESARPAPQDASPFSSPKRWARGAAAIVAVTALVSLWLLRSPSETARGLSLEISEEAITAKDLLGQVAWAHQMDAASRHIRLQHGQNTRVVLGSRPQAFAATEIQFRRSDNFVEAGRLSAFSLDGTPQWDFEFDDELRIGGKPYGAPWGLTAFAVSDAGAERRIAVAGHHYIWSASLLTILDADGRRRGTFVNDGWLEAVQWLTPDRLAVSGFSQSKDGGLVALLDPAQLGAGAQSPEVDPAHQCQNCGPAKPLRIAVMPRTEVNRVTGSRFNRATMEHVGDRLFVRTTEVAEHDRSPAEAIYEFTAGFELVSATFGERYWQLHDELFARRALDHDRAHCPDRDGPRPIHAWSPETGWTPKSVR